MSVIRARQDEILTLIKDTCYHIPLIAKSLSIPYQTAKNDVLSLLSRGKVENHAIGLNAYYVKAV